MGLSFLTGATFPLPSTVAKVPSFPCLNCLQTSPTDAYFAFFVVGVGSPLLSQGEVFMVWVSKAASSFFVSGICSASYTHNCIDHVINM